MEFWGNRIPVFSGLDFRNLKQLSELPMLKFQFSDAVRLEIRGTYAIQPSDLVWVWGFQISGPRVFGVSGFLGYGFRV